LRAAFTPTLLAGLVVCHTVAQAPERWVLVYSGGPNRPAYTVDDLLRLLTVVDTSGRSIGPLCNAVILTEFQAVSRRYYMPWQNGTPATGPDWNQYIDSVFAPRGPLARLDSAAALAARTPARPLDVAIMVPYPSPKADTLRFGGRQFTMSSDSDRLASVEAYMREVVRRVQGMSPRNVSVSAFYWLNEGVVDTDTSLVSKVAKAAHGMGMRLLWIPSWGAHNAVRWRALGFDKAWQQPNYFFHPEVATTRLDSAVDRARAAGMGLELELDRRLFSDAKFTPRLAPYLATFEKAPDLREQGIAIYEGAGALIELSRRSGREYRALYERLVAVLQSVPTP
jgi:hypothetical protein